MLTPVVCVIGFAILFGIIRLFIDFDIVDALLSALLGSLVGLVLGCLIGLLVSGIYWSNTDNYTRNETTYNLEQYSTDTDEKCYVYISNSNGKLISNVQYIDEDGTPQLLHLNSKTDYVYKKGETPKIIISEYEDIDSPWVYGSLSMTPCNEYKIILPNADVIKQAINN